MRRSRENYAVLITNYRSRLVLCHLRHCLFTKGVWRLRDSTIFNNQTPAVPYQTLISASITCLSPQPLPDPNSPHSRDDARNNGQNIFNSYSSLSQLV